MTILNSWYPSLFFDPDHLLVSFIFLVDVGFVLELFHRLQNISKIFELNNLDVCWSHGLGIKSGSKNITSKYSC